MYEEGSQQMMPVRRKSSCCRKPDRMLKSEQRISRKCALSPVREKKITLTEFRSKQQKENSLKHHASQINQFFFSERVNLSWLSKLLLKCDKTL